MFKLGYIFNIKKSPFVIKNKIYEFLRKYTKNVKKNGLSVNAQPTCNHNSD